MPSSRIADLANVIETFSSEDSWERPSPSLTSSERGASYRVSSEVEVGGRGSASPYPPPSRSSRRLIPGREPYSYLSSAGGRSSLQWLPSGETPARLHACASEDADDIREGSGGSSHYHTRANDDNLDGATALEGSTTRLRLSHLHTAHSVQRSERMQSVLPNLFKRSILKESDVPYERNMVMSHLVSSTSNRATYTKHAEESESKYIDFTVSLLDSMGGSERKRTAIIGRALGTTGKHSVHSRVSLRNRNGARSGRERSLPHRPDGSEQFDIDQMEVDDDERLSFQQRYLSYKSSRGFRSSRPGREEHSEKRVATDVKSARADISSLLHSMDDIVLSAEKMSKRLCASVSHKRGEEGGATKVK